MKKATLNEHIGASKMTFLYEFEYTTETKYRQHLLVKIPTFPVLEENPILRFFAYCLFD